MNKLNYNTYIYPRGCYMDITVVRKKPTKEQLKRLYDVCNKLFKDDETCFYSKEETKELKKDKNNVWL